MRDLLERVAQLEPFTRSGTAFRAVNLRYVNTPLSALGSVMAGGRYNPKGGFEVLYLAENAGTTLREVAFAASSGGRFQAEPKDPYVVFSVPFTLGQLVDLTDPRTLLALGVTREALCRPWRLAAARGEPVPTHTLGAALRAAKLEGFLYPSATDDTTNLAVIPENLQSGSRLEVVWEGRTLARLP